MKHKNTYWLLILTMIGMILYSCQKDDEIISQAAEQAPTEGLIKLGKKLENPYSVENMQKALDNLKNSNLSAKSSSVDNIEITTTHLYLRFKPKNEDELNILTTDSTLVLYDYPLDYEITENGYFYRDPEVRAGQPTYQYCAVPVDKKLPDGVEHEILVNLFIPDEDSDNSIESKETKKTFSADFADALVDEALRITNNLNEVSSLQNKSSLSARRSKWRPSGTIKVWDDVLNQYIGVEGVQVRARRWFTTHRGFVNASGYYSCDGEFRRDANYSIDWERYDFALQDGWLNGATYNGPKKRGNWDLNLKDDKQEYYATIFRAAHHYYYKDIKGLKRPPTNSFGKTQMKILANYKSNNEINGYHQKDIRIFGLYARIHLYNPQNSSSEIYGTTIHELAHASHWELRKNNWNDNNLPSKIKESWARGVQWELTRMVYPLYQPFYFGDYTGVVQDLIDGKSGYDQVENYTVKEIENVLSSTSSWDDWKDNLKNKYNNATENNLDAVFNRW